MKKNKILIALTTIAGGATSAIIPLSTLVGCGAKKGNLMTEYTPSIKQKEAILLDDPSDVLNRYLEAVQDNKEIFAQDLRYTLSRGMPQYFSYISEFCEITDHNFNMTVNSIDVDTENKIITTDLTFKILFDYSKTKKEEMVWYDMNVYKWDTTTRCKLTLDFDTTKSAGFDPAAQPYAAKRQMTTYAGATQFGISERNSTIQLISERGSWIDLDHKKHKIDNKEASPVYHFMLPQEDYWTSIGKKETYEQNLAEVWDVWFDQVGLQTIVLILKYLSHLL